MMTAIAIARAIGGFLKRIPWQLWVCIGSVLAGWGLYRAGWNARDEQADQERTELLASVEAAQEQSRAAHIAVIEAEQARLDAVTKEADHAHEVTRVVVRDATDQFIRNNGVQDGQCVPSGTDSAAADPGAGSAQDVPPVSVMVSASDVRACSEWVAYGMTAHQWATQIGKTD